MEDSEAGIPRRLANYFPKKLNDALARYPSLKIEEIRLHTDRICTISEGKRTHRLPCEFQENELSELLLCLCDNSLYAHRNSIEEGFVTVAGGVRVGICGQAAVEKGKILGIHRISGLIFRIPHEISLEVRSLAEAVGTGGMLIYAPPGVGKTTLLSCLARELAKEKKTVILDSRAEFSGRINDKNLLLDILLGYPKSLGFEIAVRSLGAEVILTDEIGSEEESSAILSFGNCGIPILASAHASEKEELYLRPQVKRLLDAGIFKTLVGISRTENGMHYAISGGLSS